MSLFLGILDCFTKDGDKHKRLLDFKSRKTFRVGARLGAILLSTYEHFIFIGR